MDVIKDYEINVNVVDCPIDGLVVDSSPTIIAPDTGGFESVVSAVTSNVLLADIILIVIGLLAVGLILLLGQKKQLKATKVFAVLPMIALALALFNPLAPAKADELVNVTVKKCEIASGEASANISTAMSASDYVKFSSLITSNDTDLVKISVLSATAGAYPTGEEVVLTEDGQTVYISDGPLAADSIINLVFSITVDPAIELGKYKANVKLVETYVDTEQPSEPVSVTLWCRSGYGVDNVSFAPTSAIIGEENLQSGDYIGKTITLDVGDNYTMPTPNELGLYGGECDENSYRGYPYNWVTYGKPDNINGMFLKGATALYWPSYIINAPFGSTVSITNELPVEFMSPDIEIPYPDPSEPWHSCSVKYIEYDFLNWGDCDQYWDEIDQWYTDVFDPWYNSIYSEWLSEDQDDFWSRYDNWLLGWRNFMNSYHSSNDGDWLLFDGMDLIWEEPQILS